MLAGEWRLGEPEPGLRARAHDGEDGIRTGAAVRDGAEGACEGLGLGEDRASTREGPSSQRGTTILTSPASLASFTSPTPSLAPPSPKFSSELSSRGSRKRKASPRVLEDEAERDENAAPAKQKRDGNLSKRARTVREKGQDTDKSKDKPNEGNEKGRGAVPLAPCSAPPQACSPRTLVETAVSMSTPAPTPMTMPTHLPNVSHSQSQPPCWATPFDFRVPQREGSFQGPYEGPLGGPLEGRRFGPPRMVIHASSDRVEDPNVPVPPGSGGEHALAMAAPLRSELYPVPRWAWEEARFGSGDWGAQWPLPPPPSPHFMYARLPGHAHAHILPYPHQHLQGFRHSYPQADPRPHPLAFPHSHSHLHLQPFHHPHFLPYPETFPRPHPDPPNPLQHLEAHVHMYPGSGSSLSPLQPLMPVPPSTPLTPMSPYAPLPPARGPLPGTSVQSPGTKAVHENGNEDGHEIETGPAHISRPPSLPSERGEREEHRGEYEHRHGHTHGDTAPQPRPFRSRTQPITPIPLPLPLPFPVPTPAHASVPLHMPIPLSVPTLLHMPAPSPFPASLQIPPASSIPPPALLSTPRPLPAPVPSMCGPSGLPPPPRPLLLPADTGGQEGWSTLFDSLKADREREGGRMRVRRGVKNPDSGARQQRSTAVSTSADDEGQPVGVSEVRKAGAGGADVCGADGVSEGEAGSASERADGHEGGGQRGLWGGREDAHGHRCPLCARAFRLPNSLALHLKWHWGASGLAWRRGISRVGKTAERTREDAEARAAAHSSCNPEDGEEPGSGVPLDQRESLASNGPARTPAIAESRTESPATVQPPPPANHPAHSTHVPETAAQNACMSVSKSASSSLSFVMPVIPLGTPHSSFGPGFSFGLAAPGVHPVPLPLMQVRPDGVPRTPELTRSSSVGSADGAGSPSWSERLFGYDGREESPSASLTVASDVPARPTSDSPDIVEDLEVCRDPPPALEMNTAVGLVGPADLSPLADLATLQLLP
ncbi:hypothetical protein AcV5_002554 [Taiwanofungus camphoratus]|nr:hypothetical protein AcV5_002554 [Antrodia cinnamomea]